MLWQAESGMRFRMLGGYLVGDDPLGRDGSAMLGHSDRIGLRDDEASHAWNSSHPTRGCGQEALISTGGNGYFYCFAAR